MFRRLWEYWVKGDWNVVVYGKIGKVKCKTVDYRDWETDRKSVV